MDISHAGIAGPCTLVFNGVNIGHTLDGIDFTAEREFADVTVDKYGSMPIDKVLTGTKVLIKFKLAQTDYAQFAVALPEGANYDGAGGSLDRVALGGEVGTSMRALAAPLVIHPLKNIPTNLDDDITIYRAVSFENVPLPYKIAEQEVLEVTMIGLVDEGFGPGRRIGHIGPANVS